MLAVLMWSGNWIAGRNLAGIEPPLGINIWRWFVAAALIFSGVYLSAIHRHVFRPR